MRVVVGALVICGLCVAYLTVCATCGCAGPVGRIYTSDCVHVGIRGHTDIEGIAVTARVTTDAPVCKEVYPRGLPHDD